MSGGEWPWDALCRGKDPELWFPPWVAGQAAIVEEAKLWCRACPVIEACRREVDVWEAGAPIELRSGIWAGTTPRERWKADKARKAVSVG